MMDAYLGKRSLGFLTARLAGVVLLLPSTSVLVAQARLPDTKPLLENGDLAVLMVDGIHRFLDHETEVVRTQRQRFWDVQKGRRADLVAASRERFRKLIGAVDHRLPVKALELVATTASSAQIAARPGYKVFRARWPVFEGVHGEGLLLEPSRRATVRIVAIPDADQSPEMVAGLAPGLDRAAQFARRLAEAGCEVVVLALIDRRDTWSGIPGVRMTNQPHREFIYRMAFDAGRHIIGYEVQKILAVVDWFKYRESQTEQGIVGTFGYGEGGLLALYAAALDGRIDRTVVSGYFRSRDGLWKEPIYRDVWRLLKEHGDAELVFLIEPNRLIVEASAGPRVSGPPPETQTRKGATPNGRLQTPELSAVKREVELARSDRVTLVVSGDGSGPPGSQAALEALVGDTAHRLPFPLVSSPLPATPEVDQTFVATRSKRQFDELVNFTQKLLRQSTKRREEFWSKVDTSTPERWRETSNRYRDTIWSEVIGRLPAPNQLANARSRLIFDAPKFFGYEVVLDVWPDVFTSGILLLPKDLKAGERRPVVVCQHGLEGRPRDVADPSLDDPLYQRYAVRLAEEGFVTFAPQNPYIGKDRFRLIQRKAHPLKLSLFSFILGQHQRLLEWLAALPFVDPARIGFYGLSYGGKTAMRLPPLLDQYALSICSGDFADWVWNITNADTGYSYLPTEEYEVVEFNLANIANYAELGMLMAPRPFMVERGHHDGGAPDEWVAHEFAKVRNFYVTRMKLPGHATIEFFNGGHTINGKEAFEFLRRHLHWPRALATQPGSQ